MRNNKSRPGLIAGQLALSTKLTDTSGNPGASHHWGHMTAVRRAWRRLIGNPYVNAPYMSLSEIKSIEAQVSKELYSSKSQLARSSGRQL